MLMTIIFFISFDMKCEILCEEKTKREKYKWRYDLWCALKVAHSRAKVSKDITNDDDLMSSH